MKKKLLALLLACCMVFGMLPAVSAAEAQEFTRIPVDDPTDISGGTYLIYGTSSQVMEDGSASAFMTAEGASSTRLMSRNLPITNDTVTTDDRYCVWNLIEVDGGFLIQNAATSAYLYYGDGSGNAIYQTTDVELAGIWTVISNNNGWTLQEDVSGRQLSCNRFGSEGSYYLGYASYEADSTTLRSLEFFKLGASVTEPEDTEPVETAPVETEPIETPPAESEPVETEPVETKPAETKPVVTEPSEPEPNIPDGLDLLDYGVWGGNLTWYLERNGRLTISGEGKMANEHNPDNRYPWMNYQDLITDVVIEEGITNVAKSAFSFFSQLTTVQLPDSITLIDEDAFVECRNLESVNVPANLTNLEYRCFGACTKLAEFPLPAGLTAISNEVFSGTALTHVVIPEGITTIGACAFSDCLSLESIIIPNSVTLIEHDAFMNCSSLKTIDLPDQLTAISSRTFSNSGLTSIEIPAGVTAIYDWAFDGCTSLKTITLPDSLALITSGAFSVCTNLIHVLIPEGVTSIGTGAFSYCTSLESIIIPNSVTRIEDKTFMNCSSLKTIDLPDQLTAIHSRAFNNSGLTSIEIPAGVTAIHDQAFEGCSSLNTILIPDSVFSIHETALRNCPNLRIQCYELSYAHMYAEANAIPYQLLEEDPSTPFYSISISCNSGGSVTAIPDVSPANRYVVVEMLPDSGYVPATIHYFCVSDPYYELVFQQISDTMLIFLMPASDVELEIYFMPEECPFVDVKETDYFYSPVLWALTYDITSGVSANRFGPNNACTRAQVVTFLWAAAGRPEPTSYYNPFSDVKETDYFYKAVLWAVENGITSGMSATTFGSNNPCTRAQVVTFLWAAVGRPEPSGGFFPFTDVKETDYYYKAVLFAMEYGITSGMSATSFGSNNTCTRAHVVTFLYKTFYG